MAASSDVGTADGEPVGPPVRSERPPRSRPPWVWLALGPVVLLVALGTAPYFRLNNGDPFIYVGYSNAFRTHVARFGYTYHSVRFGLIFPLRASLVAGPVVGYLALRYVLYLVATVPMWFALRPYGRNAALLGPVAFITSPVAAQAILTTHHDTFVVPFLTAFVCLLVLALRSDRLVALAALALPAGLTAGLAINANIFAAPLFVIVTLVASSLLVAERRLRLGFALGPIVLVGVGAVSAAGALAYGRMFGDANIWRTTLNAVGDISESEFWRTPGISWLGTRRYVYVPFLVLAFAAAVLVRRPGRRWARAADVRLVVLSLLLLLGFFVAHQFVLGGTSMEQAYYFSMIIGPTCLVLAAAIGWSGMIDRVPAVAVVVVPALAALVAQFLELRAFVLFVGLGLVLFVVMLWMRWWVAAVALVLLVQLAWGAGPRQIAPIEGARFQYEPHYERVFGAWWDTTAFEAYLLASRLPELVPSDPGYVVPLYFWYPTGDAMLDSVQASYHWEALTVQRSPNPGMPQITDDDMNRLRALVGGFVVLMARTDAEVEQGLTALRGRGFEVDAAAPTERLVAGDSAVMVRTVRVLAAPG